MLPNDLRFCCGGLRRPPPSHQTYPARGRRAQVPVSSKRGLGSRSLGRVSSDKVSDGRDDQRNLTSLVLLIMPVCRLVSEI